MQDTLTQSPFLLGTRFSGVYGQDQAARVCPVVQCAQGGHAYGVSQGPLRCQSWDQQAEALVGGKAVALGGQALGS